MKKKEMIRRIVAASICGTLIISMLLSTVAVVAAAEVEMAVNEQISVSTETTEQLSEEIALVEEEAMGMLVTNIKVPTEFYENIQVEIYDRESGEILKVPVYAENEWTGKMSIPVGSYMVWNVRVPGDDINNPKWTFELGEIFDVAKDGSTTLDIQCLNGIEKEQEVIDSSEGFTNTDMSDNDTIPDDQIQEEVTIGGLFLNLIKNLVTGSNLILLICLLVSAIVYWVIKKKREDM